MIIHPICPISPIRPVTKSNTQRAKEPNVNRRHMLPISFCAAILLAAGIRAQDAPPPDLTPPVPAPKIAGLVQLFDGTPASLEANWRQGGKAPQWTGENGAM